MQVIGADCMRIPRIGGVKWGVAEIFAASAALGAVVGGIATVVLVVQNDQLQSKVDRLEAKQANYTPVLEGGVLSLKSRGVELRPDFIELLPIFADAASGFPLMASDTPVRLGVPPETKDRTDARGFNSISFGLAERLICSSSNYENLCSRICTDISQEEPCPPESVVISSIDVSYVINGVPITKPVAVPDA